MFKKGDFVRGTIGASANWKGRVDRVEKCSTVTGGFYYWVHWYDLANSSDRWA